MFQEIGANEEYLIELTSALQAHDMIENGFDTGSIHIHCHSPHGYYLNVSIMGLKAYISNNDVVEKLSNFGKIKGQVIRLKYKHDHELCWRTKWESFNSNGTYLGIHPIFPQYWR